MHNNSNEKYILKVRNLHIRDSKENKDIVKGISFNVRENRCLAIVGESGSGKSMTVKAINRILPYYIKYNGIIKYKDTNILSLSKKEMQELRGKTIFMIFQDAMSSFDPTCTIEKSFLEILSEHMDCSITQLQAIMHESLKKVRLDSTQEMVKKYPSQLSGGMLQRIIIAIAFALKPELIIADEPTTSLDAITQYEIINEFIKLKENLNTSIIFISHDLGVVKKLADDVILLKDGNLMESGECKFILKSPKSDYGKYLIGMREKIGENYRLLMGGNDA